MQVRRTAEADAERSQQLSEREHALSRQQAGIADRSAELDALDSSLDDRERELEQDRARYRDQVEQELAAEREGLLAEREQLLAERAALENASQELAEQQSSWLAEQARIVAEQESAIGQERVALRAEFDQREAALQQREVDLAKRARFHDDHLARVRRQLEQQQSELEQQTAAHGVWREEVDASIRTRLSHLRRYRALLESREGLCLAAQDEISETRRRDAALVARELQELAAQHQSLQEQRGHHESELQRRTELLDLREQDLDRRTGRLGQLRDDTERTRQENVETHRLLEQVMARLAADLKVDLSAYARDLPSVPHSDSAASSAALDAQRRDLEAAESQLTEQRLAFQQEREALLEALAVREERLQMRESQLARGIGELSQRERDGQDALEEVQKERQAAESLLRELLTEIEALFRARHAA
jgi:hypothetical protein